MNLLEFWFHVRLSRILVDLIDDLWTLSGISLSFYFDVRVLQRCCCFWWLHHCFVINLFWVLLLYDHIWKTFWSEIFYIVRIFLYCRIFFFGTSFFYIYLTLEDYKTEFYVNEIGKKVEKAVHHDVVCLDYVEIGNVMFICYQNQGENHDRRLRGRRRFWMKSDNIVELHYGSSLPLFIPNRASI